jgi:hypothetical protein
MDDPNENTNKNGYLGTQMRTYLVGNFFAGLITAGVPDDVLWAPTRFVANKGYNEATCADTIVDKLWLPTEREMFGERNYSNETYETAENQARLEYYDSDAKRFKYNSDSSNIWHRLASPSVVYTSSYCDVTNGASAQGNSYNSNGGVAPAFCVR